MADPGGREPGDLVLEERHPADLEQVLGPSLGERQQPRPEAAGDDHGLDGGGSRVPRCVTCGSVCHFARSVQCRHEHPGPPRDDVPGRAGRPAAAGADPADGDVLRRRHRRADRAVGRDVRQLGGEDRRPRAGRARRRARRAAARRPPDALARRGLAGCRLEPGPDRHRRRRRWPSAPTWWCAGRTASRRTPSTRRGCRWSGCRCGRSVAGSPRSCRPASTDYGAVVLAQPDAFTAWDPPHADDAAWRDADGTATQAVLLAEAAESSLVSTGGRLLTDVNPCTRGGLGTLLAATVARRRHRVGGPPRRGRLGGARRAGARHRAAPRLTPDRARRVGPVSRPGRSAACRRRSGAGCRCRSRCAAAPRAGRWRASGPRGRSARRR